MEVIVFEKESYYKMLYEVTQFVRNMVLEEQKNDLKSYNGIDWISGDETKKLLEVRSKTKMQQLRSNGDIVYCKYGRKLKYSRESIIQFLNKNKISFERRRG